MTFEEFKRSYQNEPASTFTDFLDDDDAEITDAIYGLLDRDHELDREYTRSLQISEKHWKKIKQIFDLVDSPLYRALK